MPQVDLETLVSACGGGGVGSHDRKVACETLADGESLQERSDLQEIPSDLPPESFWLSKDAEFDWFDRNAFLERKESTKGNINSSNNVNPSSTNSSQRFSVNLKTKTSIFGLPKSQKSCFANTKLRRNTKPPANIKLFPKKPQPANKSSVPFSEPSSPKVSCMGRVRSKRDKNRRSASRKHASEQIIIPPKAEHHRKTGLWTNLRAIFRSGHRHKSNVKTNDQVTKPVVVVQSPPRKSVTFKGHDGSSSEPVAEAPGLGGMKRFESGRRSGSWVVDEISDVDLTKS